MRLTPKKTCEQIVESGNHYLGALKGNQAGLLREVKQHFQPQDTYSQVNKGHGRPLEAHGQHLPNSRWHSTVGRTVYGNSSGSNSAPAQRRLSDCWVGASPLLHFLTQRNSAAVRSSHSQLLGRGKQGALRP